MEALRISLNDYILSGGGANGESYVLKTDPTVMLKLYFPGKIRQPLDEMILARKVFEAGIPTPEPGDYVVTEDGRYGIRFNCIIGKKSYFLPNISSKSMVLRRISTPLTLIQTSSPKTIRRPVARPTTSKRASS